MSMYGQYIKEHRGDDIIESDKGFVTYRFLNDSQVYIIDIWIKPEFRRDHYATELANLVVSVARKKNCREVIGSVVPQANNATDSMKILLKYGMILKSATSDLIVFGKEI